LAQLQAVRRELRDDREHAADSPYWLLTVSAGEHTARATIAWADETLAALAELAAEDGDSPPPSSPQPDKEQP
jgi:hypothetical protein